MHTETRVIPGQTLTHPDLAVEHPVQELELWMSEHLHATDLAFDHHFSGFHFLTLGGPPC